MRAMDVLVYGIADSKMATEIIDDICGCGEDVAKAIVFKVVMGDCHVFHITEKALEKMRTNGIECLNITQDNMRRLSSKYTLSLAVMHSGQIVGRVIQVWADSQELEHATVIRYLYQAKGKHGFRQEYYIGDTTPGEPFIAIGQEGRII